MLIKQVIESLDNMFLQWNFDINIRKSGIYFQRQLSKSVSSSPRSLSLICCLIKVEMLPFLAKKSQQSNHKMGNFSCYKKLRRSCIIAKLTVSNHNVFLSISSASKINNCLMSAQDLQVVLQILHLDLEAIMNDFSTSRIIVVLLFCWIYVSVARNGKIVLHWYEYPPIISDYVVLQYFAYTKTSCWKNLDL